MPPQDDGLAAIVVPLLDRTRVHGSINILWIRTAFTVEEFAARHLADLRAAASEIVESLQTHPKRQRMRQIGYPTRPRIFCTRRQFVGWVRREAP